MVARRPADRGVLMCGRYNEDSLALGDEMRQEDAGMAAYVIVEVETEDTALMEAYRAATPPRRSPHLAAGSSSAAGAARR